MDSDSRLLNSMRSDILLKDNLGIFPGKFI
jgi:hypothetical protein